MKKLYFFLAAMLCNLAAMAAGEPDMYLIGGNVNGKSWTLKAADAKMTMTEPGVYTWTGTKLGTGFKFNDGTWSNKQWNGITLNLGGSAPLVLGEEYSLNDASSSGNIPLKGASEVENPTVTLDLNRKICKVVGAGGGEIEWFVPGLDDESMSLDDAHKMTKVSNGVYELKNFLITAPGQFAVASTGWTEKFGNLEAGITPTNLSGVLSPAFAETGNVEYTITGTYDIKWVYATKTISFTKAGGSEDVTYYLVGAEIGSATDVWNPPYADNQKFTNEGDGIYTITVSHLGNSFKINAGNWTDKTNTFGAGEGAIILGEPLYLHHRRRRRQLPVRRQRDLS